GTPRRHPPAVRPPTEVVRAAREPLRRLVHRLACDEPVRGDGLGPHGQARPLARIAAGRASRRPRAAPRGSRCRGTKARGRDPARASHRGSSRRRGSGCGEPALRAGRAHRGTRQRVAPPLLDRREDSAQPRRRLHRRRRRSHGRGHRRRGRNRRRRARRSASPNRRRRSGHARDRRRSPPPFRRRVRRRHPGRRSPARRAAAGGPELMKALEQSEVWFLCGSQHMYGEEQLRLVEEHAREIAASLDAEEDVPVRVLQKGVATSSEAILAVTRKANAATTCVGVVAWMHTFSPAKMWIAGLTALRKPLLHLHTQFNRDLPWSEIDMDVINLNQSAHGDREFGFIETRLGLRRKTVVGHWRDPAVVARLATWTRAACGWSDAQRLRVARFGDNMREVAVTEGDKVEAQLRLGVSVNGYGVGDLVEEVNAIPDAEVDRLVGEYEAAYDLSPELAAGGARRRRAAGS